MRLFVLWIAVMTIAACTTQQIERVPAAVSGGVPMSSSSLGSVLQPSDPIGMPTVIASRSASGAAVYATYAEPILTDGRPNVLFFHAPWCPFCVKSDNILKELYGTEDITLSVYKVDFDTSSALKQRYGVVTQDTFVLIDGEGTKIREITHPTRDALRTLLTSSS